jgi:fibronectin type 3 domain-containing protein
MSHQITINWGSVPGATSYNIYRGTALGNESNVPYASVIAPTTTFTDTNVFQGKVYSYEITAVVSGVESADSNQVLSPAVPFPPTPATLNIDGAASFEVLAASTVTNTGATTVAGDVGVFPGTSITGFPPGVISGVFHSADFVAQAAQAALASAFTQAAALPAGVAIPAELGGMTLKTGVYDAASSVAVTGTLNLDAEGNPNAVFIIRIPTTLTTASGNSTIALLNGAQSSNVFWVVGTSATLGTNTSFSGIVMAQASVTVVSGASVVGKLFAKTGAVTLDTNIIDAFVILGFVTPGAACIHPVQLVGDLIVLGPLPPSPPNVPPPPPAAPTGLVITSEN